MLNVKLAWKFPVQWGNAGEGSRCMVHSNRHQKGPCTDPLYTLLLQIQTGVQQALNWITPFITVEINVSTAPVHWLQFLFVGIVETELVYSFLEVLGAPTHSVPKG